MPANRQRMTKIEKVTALYSDPATYELVNTITATLGVVENSHAYSRHLTCCLVEFEARIHGNRQLTDEAINTPFAWALRAALVHRATGADLLLPVPPSVSVVSKWLTRTRSSLAKAADSPGSTPEAAIAAARTGNLLA